MSNKQETYTAQEFDSSVRKVTNERISKHIERLIIADNIKEKSSEWHLLYQLKTMVNEDRS